MKNIKQIKDLFIKNIPACIAVILLLISFIVSALNVNEKEDVSFGSYESNISSQESEQVIGDNVSEEEIIALWVTYTDLDMEEDSTEDDFRNMFSKIVKTATENKINTLIVHVRPFGDALYKSDYFPWSDVLTGVQGKAPFYDPLQIMVELAHEANLRIEAWVNPFRIMLHERNKELSDNNPAVLWKKDPLKENYTFETEEGIFYNPAYPYVRDYLVKGIAEIVKAYDVDGIHFDDYFYPLEGEGYDDKEYLSYCEEASISGECMTLQQWRMSNISMFIAQVYREIKKINPSVIFGVAPQGNITNALEAGADIYAWSSARGYIDYIAPQMYVGLENKYLPFEETLKEWREIVSNTETKLYVGIGIYKAGTDEDSFKYKNTVTAEEYEIARKVGCNGIFIFSYGYLEEERVKEEFTNLVNAIR